METHRIVDRVTHRLTRSLQIGLMMVGFFALLSVAVMWLWNWLGPAVFGWHRINFWQAVGLLVLSKILFGGLRGGRGYRGRWDRGMSERWERMTPEEREKFRKGMMGCMFSRPATGGGTEPGEAVQR